MWKTMRAGMLAVFVLCVVNTPTALATSPTLTNMHMAAVGGYNQPAVTSYPSGTGIVYFDYTVAQSDTTPGSSWQVTILRASDGSLAAYATIDAADLGNSYATLQPQVGGNWIDEGYCTLVSANGSPYSSAELPIAFVVGTGAVPTNCNAVTAARISHVSVHRAGAHAMVRWHVASNAGIAGFNVYAGGHRLNQKVAPVHMSRNYRATVPFRRGFYRVRAVLTDQA